MNFWNKIKGFMPLLPAVLVIVCVGISLAGYEAPVYTAEYDPGMVTGENQNEDDKASGNNGKIAEGFGVPDVDGAGTDEDDIDAYAEDGDDGSEDNEEESTGTSVKLISAVEASGYRDGVYYGTATGFAGPIKVEVVISGGRIKNITVISNEDDPAYFNMAKAVINNIISGQTTNVDTVSGATYSSAGIINAVRSALNQAAVTATVSSDAGYSGFSDGKNAGTGTGGTGYSSAAGTSGVPYDDGIYYGSGYGFSGKVEVAVFVRENSIKAILVIAEKDDDSYFSRACMLLDDILARQSVDGVDTVSGATYSSEGLLEAVSNALAEAEASSSGTVTAEKDKDSSESVSSSGTSGGSWTGALGNAGGSGSSSGSSGNGSLSSGTWGSGTGRSGETSGNGSEGGSVYMDGTYTIIVVCEPDEEMEFDAYNLTVTVTIKDGKITEVEVDENNMAKGNLPLIEDAVYGNDESEGVISQIIRKGIPEDIDTVSGATCTSNAIIEACLLALEAAAAGSGGN